MQITLKKVNKSSESTIQNLYQLYEYEFSMYVSTVKVNLQGKFKPAQLDQYWNDDKYHVFLILADDELAGFVMVREERENEPNFIEQFFILKYYSGKGVGKTAAKKIFSMFRGKWQVLQVKSNYPAQAFWRNVIADYTGNDYAERYDATDDRSSIQEFKN